MHNLKGLTFVVVCCSVVVTLSFIGAYRSQSVNQTHEGYRSKNIDAAFVAKLLFATDVSIDEQDLIIYDRPKGKLSFELKEYKLPLHFIHTYTSGSKTIATLLHPFDFLSRIARVLTGLNITLLPNERAIADQTQEIAIEGPRTKQAAMFTGKTKLVEAWSLQLMSSTGSLAYHDACQAVAQNTFTTTEIAKFADIIGTTLVHQVVDAYFMSCFCIKSKGTSPQFIGMRRKGSDLHVACYNLNTDLEEAPQILDVGINLMDARVDTLIKGGIMTTDVLLRNAFVSVKNTVQLEGLPGQLRAVVVGETTNAAYAFMMPHMLSNTDALKTDLSWPPRVAWRASSGKLALYTVPCIDIVNFTG